MEARPRGDRCRFATTIVADEIIKMLDEDHAKYEPVKALRDMPAEDMYLDYASYAPAFNKPCKDGVWKWETQLGPLANPKLLEAWRPVLKADFGSDIRI